MLASREPQWSTDGANWTLGGVADFKEADGDIMWSVRRFAYADHDGGRFIAVASGESRDMLVSSDGGASWWRPERIPPDCAIGVGTYGDILYGNGIIVIIDYEGNACRSTDGGHTWTVSPIGAEWIVAQGVWTGSEFMTWADGARFTSSDGVSDRRPKSSHARWLQARRAACLARSSITEGLKAAQSIAREGSQRESFARL